MLGTQRSLRRAPTLPTLTRRTKGPQRWFWVAVSRTHKALAGQCPLFESKRHIQTSHAEWGHKTNRTSSWGWRRSPLSALLFLQEQPFLFVLPGSLGKVLKVSLLLQKTRVKTEFDHSVSFSRVGFVDTGFVRGVG